MPDHFDKLCIKGLRTLISKDSSDFVRLISSIWFEAQDSDEICIKLMGYVDTVIAVGCYWIKKLIDVSVNSEFSEFLHKKVTEDI